MTSEEIKAALLFGGTLGGTAGKIKYDPTQSGLAADNVQDALDELAEDKAGKAALSLTDKKLAYLAKLTKGQSWDIENGATPAYQHTVPAGAKAVAVNGIGGKTIVWNQHYKGANITSHGITLIYDNSTEIYSLSGVSDDTYFNLNRSNTDYQNTVKSGHPAFIGVQILENPNNVQFIRFRLLNRSFDININFLTGFASDIYQNGNTQAGDNLGFLVSAGTDCTGIKLRVMYIDLTQMFGAGNEPSTVEEFRAMFPAEYYSNNTGELLSANVTAVESKDDDAVSLGTLSIPVALRMAHPLRSAGNVYDEYNIAAKKFIQRVGSRAYQSGDEDDTTVTTDKTTTHYQLTTPVETDISEYFTDDNLLTVEAGGALIFAQSNAIGAGIHVPNATEYAINLSEATA